MKIGIIALLLVSSILCILAGEILLRKGLSIQLKGDSRGLWWQLISFLVTLGFPLFLALLLR